MTTTPYMYTPEADDAHSTVVCLLALNRNNTSAEKMSVPEHLDEPNT
jgi:hypothetical protein